MLDFEKSDGFPVITEDDERRQLEKIVRSATFRNTLGLQKFLEYVVGKTLQGQSQEIKEYAIAVEVLGKTVDYDPRLDTSVRVQAHRLKEKLEEYYATEGASDDILIELPKGHYVPQFSRRHVPATKVQDSLPSATASESAESRATSADTPLIPANLKPETSRDGRALFWTASGIAAVLVFLAGVKLSPQIYQLLSPAARASQPAMDPANLRRENDVVRAIWSHFWQNSKSPIVAYSNSTFLVTETSDLLRLKAGDLDGLGAPATGQEAVRLAENPRLVEEAGPVFYEDGYTGTGEVMAVYDLTRFLLSANIPLQVERSQLIKTDELRNQNVIFLGSVLENPILSGLPLNQDFVFEQPQRPPILWRARIVNLHPRPGEKPFYEVERDDKTQVLRADYAVVSFLPGVAPGREIVILGGLTTIGTQAAAQFVTSPAGAEELLAHLGTQAPHSSVKKLPPFFQAVLRVDIRKDEILSAHFVAGHVIHAPQSNF
ncbi:MAG TPA: hypothetical protein VKW70_09970 [Terriglobia bacterium]|nr:hypothetical protein [Terriglobia bacterium]